MEEEPLLRPCAGRPDGKVLRKLCIRGEREGGGRRLAYSSKAEKEITQVLMSSVCVCACESIVQKPCQIVTRLIKQPMEVLTQPPQRNPLRCESVCSRMLENKGLRSVSGLPHCRTLNMSFIISRLQDCRSYTNNKRKLKSSWKLLSINCFYTFYD